MHLTIHPTALSASRYIANLLIGRLRAFTPSPGKPHYILGLPTGSSPETIYALLVQACRDGQVSFRDVVSFNMDEYVGLPASHTQSYRAFMDRCLFDHVDIEPGNVYMLNGMAEDLDGECEAYEAAISRLGPVDLFLGGVGSSGHIAFNEPFSSLTSRTRPVVLAASTISANARFFGDDLSKVPKRALTVGIGTIMDAKEVVIIATGRSKADAVLHGVEGAVSASWPISRLQEHPKAMIVVDEEAGSKLKGETVEYFKRVEECEAEAKAERMKPKL